MMEASKTTLFPLLFILGLIELTQGQQHKVIRVLSVQYSKISYRNFYDVTIFTQPLQADSTEGLREYCDVIEISVEYFDILNREHSNHFLLLSLSQFNQTKTEKKWKQSCFTFPHH